MHDGDRRVRQLGVGVELLQRGVVPLLDLAHEDLGQRRAVDRELAGLDAGNVDDRHDAAHHHRELHEAVLVELLARTRRIGGAEGDGLGVNLLDAAAGTDRLIVQTDAGLLLIGVGPFGVDRIGEGGAGARDVLGVCGSDGGSSGNEADGCPCGPMFHGVLSMFAAERRSRALCP